MCYEGAWILENTEGFPSLKLKKILQYIKVMLIELYVQICVLLIVLLLHHQGETSCNLGEYFSHPELESLVCHNSSL